MGGPQETNGVPAVCACDYTGAAETLRPKCVYGAPLPYRLETCWHFEYIRQRNLRLVTTFCTVYWHVMTVINYDFAAIVVSSIEHI